MVRRQWLGLAAWLLAFSSLAHATPSPEEHQVITTLIHRVAQMREMTFLRNGNAHTSTDAAEHMEAKYKHFKDEIMTAEDFIDRCASRSEVTGKPYMVKLGNEPARAAKGFLTEELRAVRKAR